MNKSNFLLGGVSIGPSSRRPPNFRRRNVEVLRCSGFHVDTAVLQTADGGRLEISPSHWQQPPVAPWLQLR